MDEFLKFCSDARRYRMWNSKSLPNDLEVFKSEVNSYRFASSVSLSDRSPNSFSSDCASAICPSRCSTTSSSSSLSKIAAISTSSLSWSVSSNCSVKAPSSSTAAGSSVSFDTEVPVFKDARFTLISSATLLLNETPSLTR